MRVGVIGAGLAGLSCARHLTAMGHAVRLFDKGRGPGGRMSSRRVDTSAGVASFDHGAQYFTARDPSFLAQVAQWEAQGVVAPWPTIGPGTWVGVPAMNAPVRCLAEDCDVRFNRHARSLRRDAEGWWIGFDDGAEGPFDTTVVAVPAEQAAPFLGLQDLAMARHATMARSQPCLTVMVAFDGAVPLSNDWLRDQGAVAWAARNSAKPGRSGPESWVLQAGGAWSSLHLEASAEFICQALIAALIAMVPAGTQLPAILHCAAHRWRFAMAAGADSGVLWNPKIGLGACGDWLIGPRVEFAWLSGRKLADAMTIEPFDPETR